jgi:hypothetical protein
MSDCAEPIIADSNHMISKVNAGKPRFVSPEILGIRKLVSFVPLTELFGLLQFGFDKRAQSYRTAIIAGRSCVRRQMALNPIAQVCAFPSPVWRTKGAKL